MTQVPCHDTDTNDTTEGEDTGCLFNISLQGLQVILDSKIDLNALYTLQAVRANVPLPTGDARVGAWIQFLTRKELISTDGNITQKGILLLDDVAAGQTTPPVVYAKSEDPFERWWKYAYPSTDHFEYKGKTYHGSQSKRIQKEQCRISYYRIINERMYSAEDIYNATLFHVASAKELSVQKGESQIHFIPNSLRYLDERLFAPFVEQVNKQSGISNCNNNNFDFNI